VNRSACIAVHLYGIQASEAFAPMVFCKQCQRQVEDCEHFVFPLKAKRVRVFDEKVESLAYAPDTGTLEIAFKTGQVWQLADVPAGMYAEIQNSTISSFLKFIARRYKASHVRTGLKPIIVPKSEKCPVCAAEMTEQNRSASSISNSIRVFWYCTGCKKAKWQTYHGTPAPEREGKVRWR
jgi:hypothetical protein